MSDETSYTQPASPSDAVKSLDRLVGTWQVSGGVNGQVIYEWMEGNFFLMQHVDFVRDDHTIKGIEIIGQERSFDAQEPGEDIKSRFYSSDGQTLDYVYELAGDSLTIWGGGKGSPAYFKGDFSSDGNTLTGAWVWPGGGYDSTMTRVK
jgi:hypothetical protein